MSRGAAKDSSAAPRLIADIGHQTTPSAVATFLRAPASCVPPPLIRNAELQWDREQPLVGGVVSKKNADQGRKRERYKNGQGGNQSRPAQQLLKRALPSRRPINTTDQFRPSNSRRVIPSGTAIVRNWAERPQPCGCRFLASVPLRTRA